MDSNASEYLPFSKRLPPLQPVWIRWRVILAGILTIATAVILNAQVRNYPQGAPLHHDLTRPVLAFELPHDARDVRVTLVPPVAADEAPSIPEMFRSSVDWDFGLILSYTTFFVWSMLMLPSTSRLWP